MMIIIVYATDLIYVQQSLLMHKITYIPCILYARCACHMIAALAAFAAVEALVEAPCAAAQVRLREWNASYNGH